MVSREQQISDLEHQLSLLRSRPSQDAVLVTLRATVSNLEAQLRESERLTQSLRANVSGAGAESTAGAPNPAGVEVANPEPVGGVAFALSHCKDRGGFVDCAIRLTNMTDEDIEFSVRGDSRAIDEQGTSHEVTARGFPKNPLPGSS